MKFRQPITYRPDVAPIAQGKTTKPFRNPSRRSSVAETLESPGENVGLSKLDHVDMYPTGDTKASLAGCLKSLEPAHFNPHATSPPPSTNRVCPVT